MNNQYFKPTAMALLISACGVLPSLGEQAREKRAGEAFSETFSIQNLERSISPSRENYKARNEKNEAVGIFLILSESDALLPSALVFEIPIQNGEKKVLDLKDEKIGLSVKGTIETFADGSVMMLGNISGGGFAGKDMLRKHSGEDAVKSFTGSLDFQATLDCILRPTQIHTLHASQTDVEKNGVSKRMGYALVAARLSAVKK